MVLTYRYRIKDATCGGHLQIHNAARRHNKRWPSGFDRITLTSGSSKLAGLHSDTVQAVCKQFALSRNACGKRPRWRGRKSLGWIPFQAPRAIRLQGDTVTFLGRRYRLWLSRPIEGKLLYRRHERALAIAQRAGRKPRVRAIHAKITNCRKHFLHELSTRLVRENRRICAGNINSCGLARTSLAKSVLDAGWSQLRSQIRYKAMRHGTEYIEVDERFSTQVCSACGVRGGPQGREGLVVRDWSCGGCGARHDRDINAAINLLVSGRNVGLR